MRYHLTQSDSKSWVVLKGVALGISVLQWPRSVPHVPLLIIMESVWLLPLLWHQGVLSTASTP